MNQKKIICFGEVLWDLLPSGKIAGGAPMNVAYHLSNFGIPTSMISRIGEDALGEKLISFLNHKEIATNLIQKDSFYPTGTVNVQLDEKGTPTYTIVQPVAWDFINLSVKNTKAVQSGKALIYGSLALRNNRSRETLFSLLKVAKFKVFDVNLRIPFISKDILETLLGQSNIVKMNDEELDMIGKWYFNESKALPLAQKIKTHFQIDTLIVTQGSKGAFAIDIANNFETVSTKKVVVQDTIGSGDSFLAGFLYQYFNRKSLIDCLDFAARTGALVATKKGGTPKITNEMVVALQ